MYSFSAGATIGAPSARARTFFSSTKVNQSALSPAAATSTRSELVAVQAFRDLGTVKAVTTLDPATLVDLTDRVVDGQPERCAALDLESGTDPAGEVLAGEG